MKDREMNEKKHYFRHHRVGEGKHEKHHGHRELNHDHEALLEVKDLWVEYSSNRKAVKAVNGVSFQLNRGESLGVVGESGCGKSTISKAILRILPDHGASMPKGEIWFKGKELIGLPEKEMEHIRGAEISMIFQDPMTALNPVKRILDQVSGVIRLHNPGISKHAAEKRAIAMLGTVGITPDRVRDFPHQFSGGMQQRVEVAIGLSCHPDLLLADEPTTALDVTIQAQVLDLMRNLMDERGTAMILITHNLGIVAEMCDNVAVVYGGEIIEYGSKREVFKNPSHPYTIGLFGAVPSLSSDGGRLKPVEGIMPEPSDLPDGCKFHTRCPYATPECARGFTPGVEGWAAAPEGFTVTVNGNRFIPGGEKSEAPGTIREGVYTWTEDGTIEWTLTLNKRGYTLEKKESEDSTVSYSGKSWSSSGNVLCCSPLLGIIPVIDLGGTHRCQCHRIEAVKEANK